MRLLTYDHRGELTLTRDLPEKDIPNYAILSHTWGDEDEEINLQDLKNGPDKSKSGYKKLKLCGDQAKRDKLDFFWVDTCCIDKTNGPELNENINLMFRYYQRSTKCYVYLSDVNEASPEKEFKDSRWFTRGWTLQELLAPKSVEFFSSAWLSLGSKVELEGKIHDITQLPLDALRCHGLSQFSKHERMHWIRDRQTKKEEDKAYCLLGIFGVSMVVNYGEGESEAFDRLERKIRRKLIPTIQDVDDRIREYYLNDGRLDIERLSGQHLPMDTCFINLGIVNRSPDSRKGSGDNERTRNPHTLDGYLNIETYHGSEVVTLEELFQPRKLVRGTNAPPKYIVIWGRAGMGKTTLCKKIIYDFLHKKLWHNLFDRVFWLPLRRLKLLPSEPKSVAQLIQHVCFSSAVDGAIPIDVLHDILQTSSDRCVFILDGMDEVSLAVDRDSPMGANINKLLKQANVVITSRPLGSNVFDRTQPDIEFETVGFSQSQIGEFFSKEVEQDNMSQTTASAIRSFIQGRPIMQSLVRIPIQLDAICYAWNQEFSKLKDVTMTMLYQAISRRLWQKDIVRLGRKFEGQCVTSQQIQTCINVNHFVGSENSCLEELAFAGLYDQVVEFGSDDMNAVGGGREPLIDTRLSNLSFLRSSDKSLNSAYQTCHFIHLTFQEFFAARYFVRHWSLCKAMVFPKMKNTSTQHWKETEVILPIDFLQQEKYSIRYNIFWRFVTGLVHVEVGSEGLCRLFEQIEAEPYDCLGVVHQQLLIHCLNEVLYDQGSFRAKAQELELGYQNWTIFEESLEQQNDSPYNISMGYTTANGRMSGFSHHEHAEKT